MSVLSVKNMAVQRGSFRVELQELTLQQGDILAICGSSGCGKSTLLEMLGFILTPDQLQKYVLQEMDLTQNILQSAPSLAQWRAKSLGFMLQTGGLLPFLNVRENICLPSQLLNQSFALDWVEHLADRLNVRHLFSKLPKQLSIGERQRIAFLRAIAHKPHILLADEPTAALDPKHAETLFSLMREIAKQEQITMCMVTHDWQLVKALGLVQLNVKIRENQAVFYQ